MFPLNVMTDLIERRKRHERWRTSVRDCIVFLHNFCVFWYFYVIPTCVLSLIWYFFNPHPGLIWSFVTIISVLIAMFLTSNVRPYMWLSKNRLHINDTYALDVLGKWHWDYDSLTSLMHINKSQIPGGIMRTYTLQGLINHGLEVWFKNERVTQISTKFRKYQDSMDVQLKTNTGSVITVGTYSFHCCPCLQYKDPTTNDLKPIIMFEIDALVHKYNKSTNNKFDVDILFEQTYFQEVYCNGKQH